VIRPWAASSPDSSERQKVITIGNYCDAGAVASVNKSATSSAASVPKCRRRLFWEQEAPGSDPGISTKHAGHGHVVKRCHDYQDRLPVI
jgi:hypothetical protein